MGSRRILRPCNANQQQIDHPVRVPLKSSPHDFGVDLSFLTKALSHGQEQGALPL